LAALPTDLCHMLSIFADGIPAFATDFSHMFSVLTYFLAT
jgi:hypothetical protein